MKTNGNCNIHCGDALAVLTTIAPCSVHCCVTSPPYFGLRDYGVEGQMGTESTPEQYVKRMTRVFEEVRRVLRDNGVLWLNIGDTYTQSVKDSGKHWGLGPKQMIGIPWRLAFALQDRGWILRQEIIWHKPNPMPSSVKDRCTTAHEQIFLFAKKPKYYYGFDAMQEPATCAGQKRGGSKNRYEQNTAGMDSKIYNTRNMRSVWTIKPDVSVNKEHFATFPEELARRCIVAGCPENGTVLDPFVGSGTTACVAVRNGRRCIGIDINPRYASLAIQRVSKETRLF